MKENQTSLFRVIINHFGLSLGETQAINSLFSRYNIDENEIEPDYEYASILEIEFIKDEKIPFFEFIPIDKWSTLIEIIKNIKKRRGKKGLKFKSIITEVHNLENTDYDKPKTLKKNIVFLLNHKDSIDFNKGLERIEITIENIIEADESQKSQSSKQETDKGFTKNTNQNKIVNDELNSISFIFDETKRRWIKSIDKTQRE
ncbi:MAG TPA: hypothetical protein VEQ18_01545 [Candidatus Nitrosocosmicus sp.]|nr:hypothetical protein [Candidatus Nitrosocosmicus sp.]